MVEIKGIYAASVSVLNDDMSLNIKKTTNHCEKIIKDGCHGVAIFGSTGQAQLISLAEKIQMVTHLSKSKKRKLYYRLWIKFLIRYNKPHEGFS